MAPGEPAAASPRAGERKDASPMPGQAKNDRRVDDVLAGGAEMHIAGRIGRNAPHLLGQALDEGNASVAERRDALPIAAASNFAARRPCR
jgi:hypothetical protein